MTPLTLTGLLLILSLIHCSPPPPSEDLEAMEEEATPQPLSLESKGITLVYRDEGGRTRWRLYADSGETTLSEQGTYGTLRKVRLTLFSPQDRNNSSETPYAVITAESGWAHQAVGSFLLEGKVHARTVEGNFELTCQKIYGTSDTGVLEAEGDVNARFGMWLLGPLQEAKAHFTSLEPSTGKRLSPSPTGIRPEELPQPLKLSNLVAKSQSTWSFRSTDGEVEITGIQEGQSELEEDGSLRVVGSGRTLRAIWKKQNLTVTGPRVEGLFFSEAGPRSNTYRLESLRVEGGVTGQWTGITEGTRWTLNLWGGSATFLRPQGIMKVEGDVRVESNHPTLGGNLTAQSATLTLDPSALTQNRYEPDGLLAEGKVTYEMAVQAERPARLLAKNFHRLSLKGKSTDETLLAWGEGSPFDVILQSEGRGNTTFRGHRFEATFSKREVSEKQAWLLSRAHFTSGIEMTTSGTLTRADGTPQPWTVEITCPEIRYEEATSTMDLLGGVKVEGNHPVIGLNGGIAEGPRMQVIFQKGTFDPIRVRWMGEPPPQASQAEWEKRTHPQASTRKSLLP